MCIASGMTCDPTMDTCCNTFDRCDTKDNGATYTCAPLIVIE